MIDITSLWGALIHFPNFYGLAFIKLSFEKLIGSFDVTDPLIIQLPSNNVTAKGSKINQKEIYNSIMFYDIIQLLLSTKW